MTKKQLICMSIAGVFALVAISSGWIYAAIESRSDAKEKELATLTSSFSQQYGTDGITITQMVSPDKVYVAVWTDKDGTTHVSWNMAGIWVTVWNGETPAP